ncbi:hypothetical protein ACF08E_10705 [Streptomyces globisporus]
MFDAGPLPARRALVKKVRLAAGDSPKKAYRACALGRRVVATGVDFVFRP